MNSGQVWNEINELYESIDILNKCQRIPKGQSNMDNPEKLATQGYTKRSTKQKHNTICVGHHYTKTSINNVNNT